VSGSLQGKTVLITGASSGIGEATARMAAAEGAAVAIAARRADRLAALERELAGAGAKTHSVELDVTDELACRAAVESAVDALGSLDVLVNNAGVMLLGPVENADTTDWTRMIHTNVLGLMYMTHAALPHLLASQGTVVQMSSVAGRVARKGLAAYNATKFAVNAFSEGLRQEVGPRGVRVVVVEPGVVETELMSHITHDDTREEFGQWAAGMRQLQPEDIAEAVRYAATAPRHVSVNEILIRPTDQV
jgi:NADP-dependent 3-hydroxy acid dehydrogenase YdfG